MKLRIISDGTTAGTYIEHAVTGERLAGVQLLSWSASCEDKETEATIHIWGVPCNIVSTVETVIVDDVFDDNPFSAGDDANEVIDISHLLKRKADE